MSKIAYECKGCGQKYRIKENAEEVNCQVCEGQLKQVKMYSVSDYEALPEAGKIKQATEGDLLEVLEVEGEVLPDVVISEDDPPLLDEEGNPLSPEGEDTENGEVTNLEIGEGESEVSKGEISPEEAEVLDTEGLENDIIVNDENMPAEMMPEGLEASAEPVEEIQSEVSEGEE